VEESITSAKLPFSVEEIRRQTQIYFKYLRELLLDAPKVAKVECIVVETQGYSIPIWIYTPMSGKENEVRGCILFLHGGGFISGSTQAYDYHCRCLALCSGCLVVSVDYRLAPEYRFPAALYDAFSTLTWIREHAQERMIDLEKISVCGSDAGATLAASLCLLSKDLQEPIIRLQVLLSPLMEINYQSESFQKYGNKYLLLTASRAEFFWDCYVNNTKEASSFDTEYAFPSSNGNHSGLPQCILVSTEFDPLRDQTLHYRRILTEAGVHVDHFDMKGCEHASEIDLSLEISKTIWLQVGILIRKILSISGNVDESIFPVPIRTESDKIDESIEKNAIQLIKEEAETTQIENPVSVTALYVAAERALETQRADRIIVDPLALKLAGKEGFSFMREILQISPHLRYSRLFAIRARFTDEAILNAAYKYNIKQVVNAACGADTTIFRLNLPEDVCFYEIDFPEVLDWKMKKLFGHKASCQHKFIKADLRSSEWQDQLKKIGFDETRPSIWITAGLLIYLPEEEVHSLFKKISNLSANGSFYVGDLSGIGFMKFPHLELFRKHGCPFLFGTDKPQKLFETYNWKVKLSSVTEKGIDYGLQLKVPSLMEELFPIERYPEIPRTWLFNAYKQDSNLKGSE